VFKTDRRVLLKLVSHSSPPFLPSLPPFLSFIPYSKVLQLCDHLRDELLPPLGVRLEDKDGVRQGGRDGRTDGRRKGGLVKQKE
jgi:hypothetical protein